MDELRGLWRGKRTDTLEWAFGCLVRSSNKTMIFAFDEKTNQMSGTEVDPSTLCECTGLRDKNGKPIFEGDIIKAVSGNTPNCFVEFREGIFYVKSQIFVYKTLWRFLRDYECEIISNIHDNPELLKGGTMKWKV